ncbi:MAG: GntR family transcriptional regulator [Oscillibacter sp.]|jgi:DNA-binding GntR family transcriptional regulator|nr:GntR family transcriptional regulator [Oscillibacter sp.]
MNLTIPKIRTIREQVYEGIKTMIINGQLSQGARVQETELAELFQVSRTPVREALNMLKDDGLLDSGSGKGLFVKALTPLNVKDIFQVRSLLEQFALREAISRLTQDEERYFLTLRSRFEAFRVYSDMEEYVQLDSELHDSIILHSGNQFLRELTGRVYNVLQPVRLFSLHTRKRYEHSITEHIGIIDGILARDLDRAASVLQTHLDEAEKGVLFLLENQASP